MGMVLGAGSCSGLENPRQGVRKEHLQVARPGLCLKQGFVSARSGQTGFVRLSLDEG